MTAVLAFFLFQLLCSSFDCEHQRGNYISGVTREVKLLDNIPAVVNTRSGTVEGFKGQVFGDRGVYFFEGIPFAEPPIGNLRFRDPVPKSKWDGILQARNPGPICVQPRGMILGREDCLYLNVYTPELPVDGNRTLNLPVIIWIHGGSFLGGSGSDYGPRYLLRRDVILVTINYRIGALGFMSTGDEASPGNYGLKDQALAIKWVHDNIAVFGGDPKRVNIMGQSAGAVSVHLQMCSTTSVARGLFHSASSLSGTGFANWALQNATYARQLTIKLASSFHCPVDSGSEAIVDCFRHMDANILVAATSRLYDFFIFPGILFGPVIEANTTAYPFLTDTVERYYERDEVAKIPFMVTSTEDEADALLLVLKSVILLPAYLSRWRYYMPTVLDLKGKVDNVDFVMDKLVKNYFGNQDPVKSNPKIWSQIASDRYYQTSLRVAVKYHSKIAPTYSYLFGFTSRVGVAQVLWDDYKKWGAAHAEELSVIFNCTKLFPAIERGEPAFEMSDIMTNLLTNFAGKGKPYYTIDNGSDVVIWEPIKDPQHIQFLRLNSGDIKMISDPFAKRLKVWKNLGIY